MMSRSDEPPTTVEQALDAGSDLLLESAPTCVVVPDATRPLDYPSAIRPLVERIATSSPIDIVVATGLHRPMTTDELRPLGEAVGDYDVDIIQHDATGPDLVDFGAADKLPDAAPDIPVALNRRVVDAERIICVGTVEPHQYAGFSGGIKAVAIGCAGRRTIAAMHGLSFLRDDATTLGRIADNPFQQSLWQIGAALDDREVLGLQVVPDTEAEVAAVTFGAIDEAYREACDVAQNLYFEDFDTPVDWMHLPVPEVKASNFYQASRAATYAGLIDRPAISAGGPIIVEAACPEGIGTGSGERACAAAMKRGRDVLLQELAGEKTPPETCGGQQRAYVLAKARKRHPIALVGAPPIDELEPMDIEQFDTIREAMSVWDLDDGKGRRIDDVFHRVPRLGG